MIILTLCYILLDYTIKKLLRGLTVEIETLATNLQQIYLDTLNYKNLRHHITRTVEDYLISALVANLKIMRLNV